MPARPTGEAPFHEEELTPTRKAIAARVLTSRREIPEFHLHAEIDAEPLLALRADLKAKLKPAPSVNDLLIKLVGVTLPRHPALNAAFVDEKVRLYEEVNVGFAVATERGVLVPVLREADAKPLARIAEETKEMIALARDGKLRASLQQGATFSISNMGPGSVDAFNAIISPPQTAILAIGALKPRPVVVGAEIAIRRTMWFTLTVDHRVIDGAMGALYLDALAAAAADPVAAVGDPD